MLKYIIISILALNMACIAVDAETPVQSITESQLAVLKAPCIESLKGAELHKVCTKFIDDVHEIERKARNKQDFWSEKCEQLWKEVNIPLRNLTKSLITRHETEPQFSQAPQALVEKACAYHDRRCRETKQALIQEANTCDITQIKNDSIKSDIEAIQVYVKETAQLDKEFDDAVNQKSSLYNHNRSELIKLSQALANKEATRPPLDLSLRQAIILKIMSKKGHTTCLQKSALCVDAIQDYLEVMQTFEK